MRIKLESQKTCIKIDKDEFQTLLIKNELYEKTIFSNGKSISFYLSLKDHASIDFEETIIKICLPNHIISEHKPNKTGLSFVLKVSNQQSHELTFQVDIKKLTTISNDKNKLF